MKIIGICAIDTTMKSLLRDLNVTLMNELAIIFDKLGIDTVCPENVTLW